MKGNKMRTLMRVGRSMWS